MNPIMEARKAAIEAAKTPKVTSAAQVAQAWGEATPAKVDPITAKLDGISAKLDQLIQLAENGPAPSPTPATVTQPQ